MGELTPPPPARHGPDVKPQTANDVVVGDDGGLTFIRGTGVNSTVTGDIPKLDRYVRPLLYTP